MSTKSVRKAIITDAGFASRYLPITKPIPKAMLPLGNKPSQFMKITFTTVLSVSKNN